MLPLVSIVSSLTEQISKRGFVVRHEVIDDDAPVRDADLVHLEEAGVHEEIEGFLLPRLPSILVAAKTGQHLGAGPVTGEVVRTGG